MDISSLSNRGMIGALGGPGGAAGVAGAAPGGNQGPDEAHGPATDTHDAVHLSPDATEHDGPSGGGVKDLLAGLSNDIHDTPQPSERLELSGPQQQQPAGAGAAGDRLAGFQNDIHDHQRATEGGSLGRQEPPAGKD